MRGGNERIRSSIACHLIMYNSYEQAHSIKKCPLSKKRTTSRGCGIPRNWSLHFTRKLNLAILSRFPGSRINAHLSFSCYRTMALRDSLLCYSDRIAQVSHLIPFSDTMYCQHLIRSLWNYTDIMIASFSLLVNDCGAIF